VRGFETHVYSREPHNDARAELVAATGGTYVSSAERDAAQRAEQVGTIDLVYEATGVTSVSFAVLQHLGINGIYVFTGIPGHQGPRPTDTAALICSMVLRNRIVLGTVNAHRPAF